MSKQYARGCSPLVLGRMHAMTLEPLRIRHEGNVCTGVVASAREGRMMQMSGCGRCQERRKQAHC